MNCFPFQLSSPSANDHSTILDYLPRLGYIFPNSESIMARAGISPACFLFICIVTPLLHVVAVQRHVTREIVCEQVAIFASFANSEIRGGAKRKKKKKKRKGLDRNETRRENMTLEKLWFQLNRTFDKSTCVGTIRESTARTYPKFNILGDGPH